MCVCERDSSINNSAGKNYLLDYRVLIIDINYERKWSCATAV